MSVPDDWLTCPVHNGEQKPENDDYVVLCRYPDGSFCDVCCQDRMDNIAVQALQRVWEILNQTPRWRAHKQLGKACRRAWSIVASALDEMGSPGADNDWFDDDVRVMGDHAEIKSLYETKNSRAAIYFKPLITGDMTEQEKVERMREWEDWQTRKGKK